MVVYCFARNPKICHVLTSFEMVRELNEGVHRMYEEKSELGLPAPEFSEPSDMVVKLVLRNDIARRVPYVAAADTVPNMAENETDNRDLVTNDRELTPVERTALDIAARDGKVSTRILAQEAGIGARTASKTLAALSERGMLTWHGTSRKDPQRHYTSK